MNVKNTKDLKGKAKLDLIPYNALVAVAAVREFGVMKYGDAWMWKMGVQSQAFSTAAIRHLFKDLQVEDIDEESGLLHLAHAACSTLMALEIKLNDIKNSDF